MSGSINLRKKWKIGCGLNVTKIHLRVKKKLSAQGLHYSVFRVFIQVNEPNKHNTINYPKDNKIKWIFTFSKERECCLPMKNMPQCQTIILYI